MIKTTAMLFEELKLYVNPTAKIRRLVESGKLIPEAVYTFTSTHPKRPSATCSTSVHR